jgi:hypothetical protein
MIKRDREALAYFIGHGVGASVLPPKGLGGGGVSNFLKRGWIERFGRDGRTGHQLYQLTLVGAAAALEDE